MLDKESIDNVSRFIDSNKQSLAYLLCWHPNETARAADVKYRIEQLTKTLTILESEK